ncbi:MAG TPA: cytochrome c oxidase subunit II, partial [Vitreimonas sp.]|nr:cytochrome c oxidase subunit II [Vitreimonas sp.]
VFLAALLLVVVLALVTGTDLRGGLQAAIDSMFPPEAVTDRGQQIRDLYNVVFLFAAAIFIAVEALIIWTVLRYRRKPGDDELPAQTHGNNLAETLWTVIPTVIVAYLFFISWQTLNTVDAVSEQPEVQVRATAGQFQWTFDYLAQDGSTVEFQQLLPTGEEGGLFLPVGRTVLVQLESPDVVHAFYVPRFLFKRDVVPGQTNTFEFTIKEEEAGQTFRGQCAELCGTGHRIMTFDVHALTQADYAAWLEEAKASAQPTDGPEASLPPNSTTIDLVAEGTAFDRNQLEAPANQPFAIRLINDDPESVPHDVDIRDTNGQTIQDQPIIPGGRETTYVYEPLEPGEYVFICSVHPIPAMTGTLTVQ